MTNIMGTWFASSLFCLGILFILVGLALIIMPTRFLTWGNSVNRWISTSAFFNALDRPRDHERFFYKHHRFLGGIIVVLAAVTIYQLAFHTNLDAMTAAVQKLAVTVFGKWLLTTIFYILIGLSVLALIAGFIIFIRPSLLKSLESWGNRWIDTGAPLDRFNEVHDIPANILPGKPRLFGCFVLLGALYIVISMGTRIF